jgi:prophage regulatory protein
MPEPQSSLPSLLRLPQVLALIPIARSTWWNGVRTGRFPAPVKIGPRTTAWRASDIRALLESFTSQFSDGPDRQ